MSTYVISDIHGQYIAYQKMLAKIAFSDDDYLYVLGDVIDRGPDGIRIIKDIKARENADLILGNHEFMMINALKYIKERGVSGAKVKRNDDGLNPLELWTHPCNGGEGTCMELAGMSEADRDELYDYLVSRDLVKRIKFGKQIYHLSHSFSLPKKFGKSLSLKKATYKQAESIVWESLFDRPADFTLGDKKFAYEDDIYVVGHIFTQRLGKIDENGMGEVYRKDDYRGVNVIDVDCGMALNSRSSRLGCLCLDTDEVFYVPLLED